MEAYGLIYIPNVAQGMVIKFGRYISPPDIEAQLALDNYLYTHSLMFTFDCYTQTGTHTCALKQRCHKVCLSPSIGSFSCGRVCETECTPCPDF